MVLVIVVVAGFAVLSMRVDDHDADNQQNYINLMVGSKQPTPVWLSPEEADLVSVEGIWGVPRADLK